jgi:hypothetical protein
LTCLAANGSGASLPTTTANSPSELAMAVLETALTADFLAMDGDGVVMESLAVT